MKLALPMLEFVPGNVICLHIPHGGHNLGNILEDELLQFANRQGKVVVISRPAGLESGDKKSFKNQTCVEWLSQAAGISKKQASKLIAGLGVRVEEKLFFNPGTPRCLMGLTATLVRKPDVMAYSTAGLDVEGHRRVHGFIESRCGQLCAVHLSYPTVYGNGSPHPRLCPPRAKCIDLAVDSAK